MQLHPYYTTRPTIIVPRLAICSEIHIKVLDNDACIAIIQLAPYHKVLAIHH